ncbi:MAG TPA: enolase C-terminal domain-like protein [Longimicrobium sp.]|nr:enolase C-terminal domain-like protein [Longimicrobium sp.]
MSGLAALPVGGAGARLGEPLAALPPPGDAVPLEAVHARAYRFPTGGPESDGTLEWASTTMVLVEVRAGGRRGVGYTCGSAAAATVVSEALAPVVLGQDAMAIPHLWQSMVRSTRNLGRSGIASMAVAALDNALWDLKARILEVPLVTLLGAVRDAVPVYGSGGFTNLDTRALVAQLTGWTEAGISRVKMKVGREREADAGRVHAVRAAIGDQVELFVDANGAYARKEALAMAAEFAAAGVTWFEEPVPSADVEGLRRVRERAPGGMEIAAGEYGWRLEDLHRLAATGAVDVLQADLTRCEGLSVFLQAGALAAACSLPLSSHTAPALHLHAACALPALRHLEYFHDHVRLEERFFDGTRAPRGGCLHPDLGRPGHGLEFKEPDARRYAL